MLPACLCGDGCPQSPKPRPRSLSETKRCRPRMMWSSTGIESISPARTRWRVMLISSGLGDGSCGVGTERVAYLTICTFLHPSPQTGRAPFSASGFPSDCLTQRGGRCFWAFVARYIHPRSGLVCPYLFNLTASLRHVMGFPHLGLLRRLRPTYSIGRRHLLPRGELYVVPKFILVSSATCLRFHLYANTWLFAKLVIGDCGLPLNFTFSFGVPRSCPSQTYQYLRNTDIR